MPSTKVLEKKKQTVAELTEKLKTATAGVFVDYCGLSVAEDTQLRNEFRKAGVEYAVVKNTMTRFAANQVGFEALDPILNGPSALALSFSDVVAPAKIISEFAKKHEKLEIKAGFVEGKIIDIKEVKALAALPSKEVLIAQVLSGFNAPISGFVNVLNGNLRGLAVALNAIAEQKAAAGE